MTHKFTYKTYFSITIFAILVYVVMASKQVPAVSADGHIELANCDTDLNVEGALYRLTDDIIGSCLITADNITIDGDDLNGGRFSIDGDVLVVAIGDNNVSTLQNIEIGRINISSPGDVVVLNSYVTGYGINITDPGNLPGANLTIEDSVISGYIFSYISNSSSGDISIIDSEVGSYVHSRSAAASTGSISISEGSTINGNVQSGLAESA